MPKFGTKSALFGYFWAAFWNQYCHIWNQLPRISLIAKFREKPKMPKFGTKNALFGYFRAGIWKEYCHIWDQYLGICLIAKFCEKMKVPKFETKNVLFGHFGVRFLKMYCPIWNQHPRICQTAKLREEIKMSKFGTRNTLFGYSRARILKKLLSYLKSSTLEFIKLQNLVEKWKCINLGPKIPYFDIFVTLKFENNIVIFEINTLDFSNCKISRKKTKILKFGTKNALFG